MGIFDVPARPEAEVRKEALVDQSLKVKDGFVQRVKRLFEMCWSYQPSDADKDLTPEELDIKITSAMSKDQALMDEYGTDAVALFVWHSKAQDLLKLDPSYVALVPPYYPEAKEDGTIVLHKWTDVTVNEDGTVTLSETLPPDPSGAI